MNIDFGNIFSVLLNTLTKFLPILLCVVAFILFIYCVKNKIHVKWFTFFKKSFRPKRGNFGLYVYCGAQGKGKTFSLIEYLLDNKDHIEIFSNINGLQHLTYTYYIGFNGLIEIKHKLDNNELDYDTNKQLVIIYDEIFTELQKKSRLNKEVLDFLCQMRKRKIIFLTTAQYWPEIPIEFRRFCRYQIQCNMIPVLWFGILIKKFHDAEQMKWDMQENEFVAPLISTTITKTRKFVAESYDTFLRISSVVDYSSAPSIKARHESNEDEQEEIENL